MGRKYSLTKLPVSWEFDNAKTASPLHPCRSYFEMPDEQDEGFRQQSPWLLRIELNREMMVDKKLSMADVGHRITQEFGDDVAVIFSDDNADKLILRIRLMQVRLRGCLTRVCFWLAADFTSD